jgi:hypothetical protein
MHLGALPFKGLIGTWADIYSLINPLSGNALSLTSKIVWC